MSPKEGKMRLFQRLAMLRHSEAGEVYVEYTVLAALAILVILGAVQYFFGGVSYLFTKMGGILRGIG